MMRYFWIPLLLAGCDTAPTPQVPPKHIIHVLDWHLVKYPAFKADVTSSNPELSQEEIDAAYEEHLNDVEEVQAQQCEILLRLLKEHRLSAVYLESLTPENLELFETLVEAVRYAGSEIAKLRPHAAKLDEDGRQLLASLERDYRMQMLRIGAAGQLYAEGKLTYVYPAEDREAHRQANPVSEGTVEIDEAQMEIREDAIAKNLRAGGPVVVVVLGAAHDLGNNLGPAAKVKYERVACPKVSALY